VTLSTMELLLGVLVVVLLLHALSWRAVQRLAVAAPGWAPRIRTSRAWAPTRPVRAWLRLRHPRLCAFLNARFNPHLFTGPPLRRPHPAGPAAQPVSHGRAFIL
jgi:hypothetical protein